MPDAEKSKLEKGPHESAESQIDNFNTMLNKLETQLIEYKAIMKTDIERREKQIAENKAKMAENAAKMAENTKALQEGEKLSFDAMKHLTTLNTGSILLLVTFLEKIFRENQEWKALVGAALICFVLSILGAVSSMFQSTDLFVATASTRELHSGELLEKVRFSSLTQRFCLLTFVLGIICLIVFAFKNLY